MFQFGGSRACSPELISKIADVIDAPIAVTRSGNFGLFDHRIVYANKAFCRLTGFAEDELIGRSPDILCDQRKGADAMRGFYDYCRAGIEFATQISSYSKSGKEFELKLQVTPTFDQATGTANYIITCEQQSENQMALPAREENTQPLRQSEAPQTWLAPVRPEVQTYNAPNLNVVREEQKTEAPQTLSIPLNTESDNEDDHKFREMTLDEMLAEFRKNYNSEEFDSAPEPQGYDDEEYVEENYQQEQAEEEQQDQYQGQEQNQDNVTGVNEFLKSLDYKSREVAKHDARIDSAMESDVSGETAREDLENMTRSQFLTNMSHDLRTPLNAIIGFSEVIRDQLFGPIDNPRYISYANDIYKSGQELLATVNELMELSEVEPQSNELEEEDFILTETLENVLDLLSARAFQMDVKIIRHMTDQEIKYAGDRRKIKQAFAGILGNSIKYSPSGGKVEITTQICPEGNFELLVYLKTANMVATRSSMGSLLGTVTSRVESEYPEIMMARKFTEMHGGKFSIFNSATSGTEIKLALPGERIIRTPERKAKLKVIN